MRASRMECNLPNPDTRICTSTSQLPRLLSTSTFKPEYGVDPAHTSILDTDVPPDIFNAPDVDVGIERAGGAVPVVGGPGEGVDAGGVV